MDKGDGWVVILCVFLVAACYYDYRRSRIPNWLVTFLFVMGIADNLLDGGVWALTGFFISVLLVVLTLYPFFKIGGLGAGDIKLLGVCAGYFPTGKIILFLFFSMLVAAIISFIHLLREQNLGERISYFGEYVLDVLRSGRWKLYVEEDAQERRTGICMSGPILCSVLMYWGGIY